MSYESTLQELINMGEDMPCRQAGRESGTYLCGRTGCERIQQIKHLQKINEARSEFFLRAGRICKLKKNNMPLGEMTTATNSLGDSEVKRKNNHGADELDSTRCR